MTEIPPEIGQLKNLRYLNIAGNRIRWLPAEILQLKLEKLVLQPNHFIESPKTSTLGDPSGPVQGRLPQPIPFVELMLRKLISPHPGLGGDISVLAFHYTDPIRSGFCIPNHLLDALHACDRVSIPQSSGRKPSLKVSSDRSLFEKHSYMEVTGVGRCNGNACNGVFLLPAEEKLVWRPVAQLIAGSRNGAELYPIRLRGCSHGCLGEEEEVEDESRDEGKGEEQVGEVFTFQKEGLDDLWD